MSKHFEALKARKAAIWPWLSCQYTKNTLMDEPWRAYKAGKYEVAGAISLEPENVSFYSKTFPTNHTMNM